MRRVGDRGAPPTPLTHLSAEAVEPLHYLVRLFPMLAVVVMTIMMTTV